MLTYQTLKEHPRSFKALTNLEPEEFEGCLPAFAQALATRLDSLEQQRPQPRRRKRGGGRKGRLLTIADKFLFILIYFNLYPLQEIQGQLFGLSQGQANMWIHLLGPVLQEVLGCPPPQSERTAGNLAQILTVCNGLPAKIL